MIKNTVFLREKYTDYPIQFPETRAILSGMEYHLLYAPSASFSLLAGGGFFLLKIITRGTLGGDRRIRAGFRMAALRLRT
ncbi:MAG: hypothetical protein GTO12_09395 [Proteobacteria bacterium]|nr:hypothetical protein [Pseudomonadota bacterium]